MAGFSNFGKARALELQARNGRLLADLVETELRLNELFDAVLALVPDCWDDDIAPDAIIIEFVTALVNGTVAAPGHRDGCGCTE